MIDTVFDYILVFILYWSVQSLIAISLLPVLLKMIDEREGYKSDSSSVPTRTRYNYKEFRKNVAKKIALSPLGLVFVLVAIYRDREVK